jgi:2-C-methyl-D-erythritol 4-phosphate cytidylyltransferase
MHVTAIILAAGCGSRMNLRITKQKLPIGAESVLKRTVRIFNGCQDIDSIIVVMREGEEDFVKREISSFEKVKEITFGGKTRAESAKAGFDLAYGKADLVAIHDAARCFVDEDIISAVIRDAKKYGAATASTAVVDTVKRISSDGFILSTVPRDELRLVQTPQVFRADLYKKAIDSADLSRGDFTDDNMLLERIGVYPYCTLTDKTNIKLTTKEDLHYMNFLVGGEVDE